MDEGRSKSALEGAEWGAPKGGRPSKSLDPQSPLSPPILLPLPLDFIEGCREARSKGVMVPPAGASGACGAKMCKAGAAWSLLEVFRNLLCSKDARKRKANA